MSAEDKLRKFAQGIFEISNWPEGDIGDIDGGEMQELAEQCGLLVATTPLEPCAKDHPDDPCPCLEAYYPEDFVAGKVTCYRRTALLTGEKP